MELRTRLLNIPFFASLFALSLFLAPSFGQAQEIDPFQCSLLPDSEAVLVPVGISAAVHPFGSDPGTYPNEFNPDSAIVSRAFSQVFRLYLTDSVSARWSQGEWEQIITTIMNNDTTATSDDVFGKVWGYFLRDDKDLNPWYAGVRFVADADTFTTIDLYLYDASDIPCPCAPTYGDACSGYSEYYGRNELLINANDFACPSDSACATCGPITLDEMVNRGIAHELQHLCFRANFQNGYPGVNETLSTLAEYFMDAWGPTVFDIPYDASCMDVEADGCDIPRGPAYPNDPPKYYVYKPWVIHLYEVFKGAAEDPTDDLLYRWIRNNDPNIWRLGLKQLSNVLWDDDFAWMGGTDARDRLGSAYGDFLVSKFCNAPDFGSHGEFGNGPVNTVEKLGFFLDNCDTERIGIPEVPVDCPPYDSLHSGCWNVRVVPPSYVLTNDHENTMVNVSGIYQNGDDTPEVAEWDTSTDYIDVYVWGTDYIVFRAGAYFQDGGEHELRISVSGTHKEPPASGVQPIGRIMAYTEDEGMLPLHPEDLLFVEPLTFSPATTSSAPVIARTVTVTDFGRSVKAVVLAIGAVSIYPGLDFPYNAFVYEYDYGVFTPGTSTRTWDGDVYAIGDVTVPDAGTLDIGAGTQVKIWPSDIAATGADQGLVEFNVEGTLNADGSAEAPVVFKSWSQASDEDWVGFYFDNASGGGTFDHCTISNAVYGIDSYVPVTVTNSEIKTCFYGVFASAGAVVQNCTLTDFKWHGIYLQTGGASTVRNTIVDGADYYGLAKMTQASLVLRNSQFKNSDTGLWIVGSGSANVDSTCSFYGNDTGIHLYGAGSSATIRGSSIINNTSNGILCDNASHPLIDGNMFDVNSVAIYCSQSSSPTVKNSQLQHFNVAVLAASSSNPDLGHYNSTGNNTIGFTYEHGRYVANYTASSIFAQNNCWNVSETPPCAPPAGMFLGAVDRSQPNCCTFGELMVFQAPKDPPAEGRLTTALVGVVPNPFNPTTTIHYSLSSQSDVKINIYDAAGRLVQELTRGTQSAGPHSAVWNGTDRRGSPVASGVYFVRMASSGQVFTRKMLLLK